MTKIKCSCDPENGKFCCGIHEMIHEEDCKVFKIFNEYLPKGEDVTTAKSNEKQQ